MQAETILPATAPTAAKAIPLAFVLVELDVCEVGMTAEDVHIDYSPPKRVEGEGGMRHAGCIPAETERGGGTCAWGRVAERAGQIASLSALGDMRPSDPSHCALEQELVAEEVRVVQVHHWERVSQPCQSWPKACAVAQTAPPTAKRVHIWFLAAAAFAS
jgi:hypothetical protein